MHQYNAKGELLSSVLFRIGGTWKLQIQLEQEVSRSKEAGDVASNR